VNAQVLTGGHSICGSSLVAALAVARGGYGWISTVLGFLAVVFAMMNVVGGYAVTDRMLQMFKRKPEDR
jgi:NAD(P) transhydrogenase subunit alpha